MGRRLLGVVLCGGVSRRMGVDKAGLRHPDGGTFLQFAIRRLRPVCHEILLAGRTINGDEEEKVIGIIDQTPLAGPMSGIIDALEYATSTDAQGILVTPVDMPMLNTDDLNELRNRWFRESSQPIIAISEGDKFEPLVAVYPLAALDSLRTSFARNERSMKRWLKTTPHDRHKISARSATNINFPDDYKNL